jgi:hypothetical protein
MSSKPKYLLNYNKRSDQMQNLEQLRTILNWERDNWRLGNVYKNRLAKKPVEVVRNELENLKQLAKDVSFEVVPRGGKLIGGDKIVTFKKG